MVKSIFFLFFIMTNPDLESLDSSTKKFELIIVGYIYVMNLDLVSLDF